MLAGKMFSGANTYYSDKQPFAEHEHILELVLSNSKCKMKSVGSKYTTLMFIKRWVVLSYCIIIRPWLHKGHMHDMHVASV